MKRAHLRQLPLLLALLGALVVSSSFWGARPALAANQYGGNSWTLYRLPWQHGQGHFLTQGQQTAPPLNHNQIYNQYALDFGMPTGTSLLSITDGVFCQMGDVLNPHGLGLWVVEVATAATGTFPNPQRTQPTDYYFYGHMDFAYTPACYDETGEHWGNTYQGQVLGRSGHSGAVTCSPAPCDPSHVHMTVQNPGSRWYTAAGADVSVQFPPLSGLNSWVYFDQYFADSVLAGDDNTIPSPNFNITMWGKWIGWGGLYGPGSTWDNGSGPGVHGWCNGVTQDFDGYPGYAPGPGAIMLRNGQPSAFWVHGAIWSYYASLGGACSAYGYPISDEYAWNGNAGARTFRVGRSAGMGPR